MEKLDKVIAGLRCCSIPDCRECPYHGSECVRRLPEDALEMLKEMTEDNERLREMWAEATKKLSVARAERDAAREKSARIFGMAEKEWLEEVHPDWYERLENLDYNYDPVKDGTPWYRAEDVWACIEEVSE